MRSKSNNWHPHSSSLKPVYSYKVKIINPHKKSEIIVRQLNKFSSKFDTPLDVRLKLISECGEHVPNTADFNVGFYDGGQQAKVWIVTAAIFRQCTPIIQVVVTLLYGVMESN